MVNVLMDRDEGFKSVERRLVLCLRGREGREAARAAEQSGHQEQQSHALRGNEQRGSEGSGAANKVLSAPWGVQGSEGRAGGAPGNTRGGRAAVLVAAWEAVGSLP